MPDKEIFDEIEYDYDILLKGSGACISEQGINNTAQGMKGRKSRKKQPFITKEELYPL